MMNFNPSNSSNTPNHKQIKKQCSSNTPKLAKNISEIKLKKVEALTPKSSFTNINNKLKQVWALNAQNNNKSPQFKRGQAGKSAENIRKKRNLTAIADLDHNHNQ